MTAISVPKILVPLTITDDMLVSSSVPEPDVGETAWVSGGTYVGGDIRIRATTHRKYMAQTNHTGISTPPENDPTRWLDVGATNRWAMFDPRRTTQTTAATSITVVLKPGFFNALAFYLTQGATLQVSVLDAPLGTEIYADTRSLDGPYIDEYDWCWGPFREQTKQVFSNILPYPEAQVGGMLPPDIQSFTGFSVAAGLVQWFAHQAGADLGPIVHVPALMLVALLGGMGLFGLRRHRRCHLPGGPGGR